MGDLLSAVDRLTLPQIEYVAQHGDDGKWSRTHTVVHKPLLRQLADRVTPSGIPDGAGGKASPAERSVADLNALYELAKMGSQIRSWCRIRHLPVTTPPNADVVADLVAWGESASGDPSFNGSWYAGTLERWAERIETILHPGERFESDYPCPVCKMMGWGNAVDGGSTRAILVTYQKDDTGRMFDERAMCRAGCNTVWLGHESVMELAGEQHESL